jgi:hypothetical protein
MQGCSSLAIGARLLLEALLLFSSVSASGDITLIATWRSSETWTPR